MLRAVTYMHIFKQLKHVYINGKMFLIDVLLNEKGGAKILMINKKGTSKQKSSRNRKTYESVDNRNLSKILRLYNKNRR